MKQQQKLFILALILFIFGLLHVQTVSAEENPCLACHANLKEPAKYLHAALKTGCETCHRKEEGKSHPEQKKSIVLIQNMPKLCYGCHDQSKFKGRWCTRLEAECVQAAMILINRIPIRFSRSPYRRYVIPVMTKEFHQEKVHSVINVVGCTTCHSPHASDFPNLLPLLRPMSVLRVISPSHPEVT
jgi:predicted CXXCH cytochrome family protein